MAIALESEPRGTYPEHIPGSSGDLHYCSVFKCAYDARSQMLYPEVKFPENPSTSHSLAGQVLDILVRQADVPRLTVRREIIRLGLDEHLEKINQYREKRGMRALDLGKLIDHFTRLNNNGYGNKPAEDFPLPEELVA